MSVGKNRDLLCLLLLQSANDRTLRLLWHPGDDAFELQAERDWLALTNQVALQNGGSRSVINEKMQALQSVAYKFIPVCCLQKNWVLTKYSGLELILAEYCNHEGSVWVFF